MQLYLPPRHGNVPILILWGGLQTSVLTRMVHGNKAFPRILTPQGKQCNCTYHHTPWSRPDIKPRWGIELRLTHQKSPPSTCNCTFLDNKGFLRIYTPRGVRSGTVPSHAPSHGYVPILRLWGGSMGAKLRFAHQWDHLHLQPPISR